MIELSQISALIELAMRAPKSQAESFWLQNLVKTMQLEQAKQQLANQNKENES